MQSFHPMILVVFFAALLVTTSCRQPPLVSLAADAAQHVAPRSLSLSSFISTLYRRAAAHSANEDKKEDSQAVLGTPNNLAVTTSSADGENADDPHQRMQELVASQGCVLEQHFVTTDDGYVLGVSRIPHGRNNIPSLPNFHRQPVILQHGLLDSAATWVVNFPHQSLGFLLADAGYDVWLPNSRGNAFSRNHTGFSPSSSEFWDFTFSDMAEHDVPAVVNYIIKATDAEKVAYVGHSQGGTIGLAALSSEIIGDALQSQISIFIGLAPAAYVRYVGSVPLLLLAQLQADQLFNLIGQHEFLPSFSKATAELFGQVCAATPPACLSILTAICGYNQRNLNASRLGTYVSYAPSGTSVKNMAHWSQMVRQSAEKQEFVFRKYDYGKDCYTRRGAPQNCNRREYGKASYDEPPSYDLSRLTDVPIALFGGGQDKLADPVDLEALVEVLPRGAVVHLQSEASYEHLDFTWGMNAAEKVYGAVLELLGKYHSSRSSESSSESDAKLGETM